MKGWVLTEDGKILYSLSGGIEVFKTKNSLYDSYLESFGDLNRIQKVEVKFIFQKGCRGSYKHLYTNKTTGQRINYCWYCNKKK